MRSLSEKVANSYRIGGKPKANPNNKTTRRRRALYNKIVGESHGNINEQIARSMDIIRANRPLIESYIISRNESPLENVEDLIKQAYELRSREIDDTANLLGVSDGEAVLFIEDEDSFQGEVNSYQGDNKLGELFAPIGIAAKYLSFNGEGEQPEAFIDPNLVSGLLNTIGGKLDVTQLRHAAENKPSGVVGFLTGGKKEYEALRSYLQLKENADEKSKVLKGIITSVQQLRGYGYLPTGQGAINIGGADVIKELERQKKREFISKNLPFIILGVVLLIFVTILIVKNAKRS